MRLEKGVLVVGARLNVAPAALKDVLAGLDQPTRVCDTAVVH
jgi:hypothetical protein